VLNTQSKRTVHSMLTCCTLNVNMLYTQCKRAKHSM